MAGWYIAVANVPAGLGGSVQRCLWCRELSDRPPRPRVAVVGLLLMGLHCFYCHSAQETLSSAQTQGLMMYLSISLNAFPMSQSGM